MVSGGGEVRCVPPGSSGGGWVAGYSLPQAVCQGLTGSWGRSECLPCLLLYPVPAPLTPTVLWNCHQLFIFLTAPLTWQLLGGRTVFCAFVSWSPQQTPNTQIDVDSQRELMALKRLCGTAGAKCRHALSIHSERSAARRCGGRWFYALGNFTC